MMAASKFHATRAPRKPKSFAQIAAAIRTLGTGEACHSVLRPARLSPAMQEAAEATLPDAARAPSAGFTMRKRRVLWVTGGRLQSGLHFDTECVTAGALAVPLGLRPPSRSGRTH